MWNGRGIPLRYIGRRKDVACVLSYRSDVWMVFPPSVENGTCTFLKKVSHEQGDPHTKKRAMQTKNSSPIRGRVHPTIGTQRKSKEVFLAQERRRQARGNPNRALTSGRYEATQEGTPTSTLTLPQVQSFRHQNRGRPGGQGGQPTSGFCDRRSTDPL